MIHKYKQSKQSGFTTIELLVVIAVIAVLAAGVIAAANRMRNQAQDQQVRSLLNEVGSVQEQIASENQGNYASPGDVGSNSDQRLQDIQTNMQDSIEDNLNLKVWAASNGQSFAAVVQRANQSGHFCVDNTGETLGSTATGSHHEIVKNVNASGVTGQPVNCDPNA